MVRFDDLQVFVRAADLGSLSAAARVMDMSPAVASAALKRLEADIDAGKVDAVLVVRLDRIMRSTANFVQFLTTLEERPDGTPRKRPIALIAIDQNLDTSTPAGRLMRTIIMAVAEYERDIIRERIKKAGFEIA